MPRRISANNLGWYALRTVGGVVFEAIETVYELAGVDYEPVDLNCGDKAKMLREAMGRRSPAKIKGDAVETTIRIAVKSTKAEAIMRSIGMTFRDLDADNAFVMRKTNPSKTMQAMALRKTGIKLDHDYLCCAEASRLIQLPTFHLQKQYNITSIETREVKLPKVITAGGLRIGSAQFHGRDIPVYRPTKNLDELCLPSVVIGGMGTGKTKGFGANLAVEAVKNGFGAVVIDPAKGELGDEIESCVPTTRVRFGHTPIALDWCEARYSDRARNRLANELIAFCEDATDEAGAQTVRYLRSAAKIVPHGRLDEVIQLFTDSAYRKSLLDDMPERDRITWQQFDRLSEARQNQIAIPVLNRLDVVMGDDYLWSCMESTNSLDFVSLLSKPQAIVLDIPKSELGAEAVDVLAGLISTKLDLAMVLRETNFPVFIIQDEPHQYQRSSRIWRSAAVESRKWRFSYVWMFHAWEQIPRDVAAIIQSAGPHYHIYTSSKKTYQALAEEIKPFEVEEAMKTPMHSAINVIRAGGKVQSAFMAKMSPPPSF